MTTPRKGPSLGDVARLAGVSPQTASRVSTGSDLVSEKTEQKVRRAMQELGYIPNLAARALRQGSYKALGVVTQQLDLTGESLTTAGIVDAAAARGYTVTVMQIRESKVRDLDVTLRRLTDLPIDGLFVIRLGPESKNRIEIPAHLPVMTFDWNLAGTFPSVVGDQPQGVRDLMHHLVDLGHRNIHHVMGPLDSGSATSRRDEYLRVLKELGLPEGKVWEGDWTVKSGYKIGKEIAQDPSVTAVFCSNDEMAFGVMHALGEYGLRVPQDISVAGFDGTAISEFANPSLTTVRHNFHSIAKIAVKKMIEEIEEGKHSPVEPELYPMTMIVRESTAPPSVERLAALSAENSLRV